MELFRHVAACIKATYTIECDASKLTKGDCEGGFPTQLSSPRLPGRLPDHSS